MIYTDFQKKLLKRGGRIRSFMGEKAMQTRLTLLRIVALALLIYSLALFVTSVREAAQAENTAAELAEEYERARTEKLALEAKLESAQTDGGMERLARERLGLVMPGEKIFYFINAAADEEPAADGSA